MSLHHCELCALIDERDQLKAQVESLEGRLEWMSDHADEHRLKCQLLTNEIEKLKESKQRGG